MTLIGPLPKCHHVIDITHTITCYNSPHSSKIHMQSIWLIPNISICMLYLFQYPHHPPWPSPHSCHPHRPQQHGPLSMVKVKLDGQALLIKKKHSLFKFPSSPLPLPLPDCMSIPHTVNLHSMYFCSAQYCAGYQMHRGLRYIWPQNMSSGFVIQIWSVPTKFAR